MRRTILLFTALSLAAGFLAGIAAAAGGITEPTTIEVIEVGGGDKYVDNGRAGFTRGDTQTVSHPLYTTDGQTPLGDVKGSCIVVVTDEKHDFAGQEWECAVTARFAEGNVMVAGSFPPPEASPAWAVTGGTGLYENARGTMVFGSGPNDEVSLTFALIP